MPHRSVGDEAHADAVGLMGAYAGIGSRQTPDEVCDRMSDIALRLAENWTLRSGGADKADEAFALGALGACGDVEIYLPWPDFNDFCREDPDDDAIVERWKPQAEAFELAALFHPAWDSLSRGAKALHARNSHQILGPDVTKPDLSKFVICWTPQASGSGGTGQALRIAKHYDVPVFDLADAAARTRIERWLEREGVAQ